MNRLAIAVKALMAVLLMGMVACSGSDNSNNGGTPADSIQSNAKKADKFEASTNIRYIDMDSILSNYTLAQEISSQAQQAMLQLQQVQRQKESELQTLGNSIQQKAQSNGYLTDRKSVV